MVDYRVRSVSLLNLVNDIRNERLVPDAYFQRNLVWRGVHKEEFIKTILLGYPFPEIFISQGKVDVEHMSAVSCLVDGQQRLNAIMEYIDGSFDVDGRSYQELTEDEKSDFLRYEIAVIELNLTNDDPKVLEIFKRINRTSNSLTSIEKLASEYAASDFLLVARHFCGQIDLSKHLENDIRENPNVPEEFFEWARTCKVSKLTQLITKKGIFTQQELSRKVQLMHLLNIMSSVLVGFYSRNEKAINNLNDFAIDFPQKSELALWLEDAASIILKLKLKASSYFYNKANFFTLMVAIAETQKYGATINPERLSQLLLGFEREVPNEYRLAASEGVNSTRARQLRNGYIYRLIEGSIVRNER